jgi:4-hydroxybenzoate polyprenyltransferase
MLPSRNPVAYLKSARPIQLLKTIVAVGWGQYCANANHFVFRSDSLCSIFGMVMLCAGLYGLNDIADLHEDLNTVHKRFRPLASGEIGSQELLGMNLFQLAVALLILLWTGIRPSLIGLSMVLNQWSYSFKPLRLKRYFLLDIASAALFTHGAKFAVGLQSGPVRNGLWFAGAALVFWKIAAYLIYRLQDVPMGKPVPDGTAGRLGARVTTAISAVAIIASYACLSVYARRTHLSALVLVTLTLFYTAAICLYLRFQSGRYSKAMQILVFSATRRNLAVDAGDAI